MWIIGAGVAISIVGWIVLLVASSMEPTGSSLFARPDANVPLLAIASSVINLGYAVAIFGAVWELPRRVSNALLGRSATESIEEPAPETERSGASSSKPLTPDSFAEGPASEPVDDVWSEVRSEFERHFRVKARVHPNGRIILLKDSREFGFDTVDQAWDYCLKHFYVRASQR
jgi:hypothetical protein